MIIEVLDKLNEFNENIFAGFDGFIENLHLSGWLADAIIDSFHILPLLFLVFFIIEVVEFFFADKINDFIKKSEKMATTIGSLAAIIPQCGFSVIASTLYIRKYLTKGTLIAIYLATSDEAIPILLANPSQIHYVLPIIGIKILIGICAGYLIDFVLKDDKYIPTPAEIAHYHSEDDGCCNHSVSNRRKRELIYHPLKHTINIFGFILVITIVLNFLIEIYSAHPIFSNYLGTVKFFEPIVTSIVGLIPNCAVSIAFATLLMKDSITFGAAVAGLLSNAGLGILVLLRHNENFKDTMKIILILLGISALSGMVIQFIAG